MLIVREEVLLVLREERDFQRFGRGEDRRFTTKGPTKLKEGKRALGRTGISPVPLLLVLVLR